MLNDSSEVLALGSSSTAELNRSLLAREQSYQRTCLRVYGLPLEIKPELSPG